MLFVEESRAILDLVVRSCLKIYTLGVYTLGFDDLWLSNLGLPSLNQASTLLPGGLHFGDALSQAAHLGSGRSLTGRRVYTLGVCALQLSNFGLPILNLVERFSFWGSTL